MKMKKILAVLLCIAMMLSMSGLTVFATSSVAEVNGVPYNSLAEALNKASDLDGEVTIELTADVEWETGAGHGSTPFVPEESTAIVTINGNDNTIITTGAGVGPIRAANNMLLTFKNVNFVDNSVSYAEDSWEFTYLEFAGKLKFVNCDFKDEIQLDSESADFENCTFESNEESVYAVWVSNGTVTFTDNCYFTGYRGLKMHEAYDSDIVSAKIENCKFENITKKPGVAIGVLNNTTSVEISDCEFINVQAGDQGGYIFETGTDVSTFTFESEENKVVNGSITPGYTNEARVWGEGGANANESFVVELYSGDEKIAQASLNDYENFIDGDVYVTWGIPFNGEDSKYWTVDWYGGNPCVDTVPTKVVLVADGVKVAENEVQMNAPDNLYPVKWEEIEAVRGSLPNAVVENLGAITVDKYKDFIKDGLSGPEYTEPILNVPVAMEFVAKDTVEEAEKNAYADYITDFFIKIEGLENGSFIADDCYLVGNYAAWGWYKISLDDMTIENGKTYPVVSTMMNQGLTYVDICNWVKKFYCGMYLSDEVLEANPNIKVTLSLGLSKTLEKAQAGDFITVDKAYTYGYADFKNEKPEIASYLATDAGYYDVNGEKSGLIRFLFGFDTEETNIETGVRFIKDGDITAQVGETISGTSKAFHADITGIKETSDKTYYAVAFLKVNPDTENEKVYWSDVASCTPNFEKFFGTKGQ